jgi:hypothetical protein
LLERFAEVRSLTHCSVDKGEGGVEKGALAVMSVWAKEQGSGVLKKREFD